MPTWRAALVYKPVPAGSIYFAAGTSFNPSAESLSLSASNANLPPEKNKTYELGSKWDLDGGKMSVRGAVFRTEKTNAREPDPNNSLLNVLAGDQRVDGAQIEVRGRLTSRWEMLSSYAYLDGKVVSSKYYPAAVGARLANVPANTFNFWTNYRLPRQWKFGAGGNFVSSRTASSTVPFDPTTGLVKEVPGYWVFNAMAKHRLTEHVDLQVNVYNIANRYYYDNCIRRNRPWAGALGVDRSQVQVLGSQRMLLPIPDVLTSEQVAEARRVLDQAEWVDGRVTAGHQSALAKDNVQVPENHPAAKLLGEMILSALGQNALFISAALPLKVFPPLFNAIRAANLSAPTWITRFVR